jgi:hypothetical protein
MHKRMIQTVQTGWVFRKNTGEAHAFRLQQLRKRVAIPATEVNPVEP